MIVLLLAPGLALADTTKEQAKPDDDGPIMTGTPLKWEHPEFSTADWVATGLAGAVGLAMQFVPSVTPKLDRGLLFDDDVQDALVLEDLEGQRTVRSVSDVLLTLLTAYPYLVDSLLVAAWYRQSPRAAWQMALINLQSMAVTVAITSVVKIAVGRTRPYSETCGVDRPETSRDCEGNRRHYSFFSGHSSMAFASAGLICMHHMYLELYDNRAADIGACVAAYGAATATGILRIVGDQHYFTDVVVGAAVGTITGVGLPYVLHYRHGKDGAGRTGKGEAVEAALVPLANGLAISGIFDETGGDGEDGDSAPDSLQLKGKSSGNPWKQGEPRLFLATRLDLGFLFLKPRISAGYGRPHDVWIGVDINPLISFEGVGAWGGLRGALSWIDLRVGARYQYTWRRSYVARKATYSKDDIEDRAGPDSTYTSLEAELTFGLPLGPGSIKVEAALTYILGVDDGWNVYEETIKVVAEPPWVWRARVGYMFPLDRDKVFRVGLVTEVVGVPERRTYTLRGGLLGSARLTRSLEARFTFMPVWYGDDNLGSSGSDLLLVGVRHRWATGMPVLQ